MFCFVGFVVFCTLLVKRSLGYDDTKTKHDFIAKMNEKKDVVLTNGTLVTFTALRDIQANLLETPFDDPKNPNNFWGKVGDRESFATPSMTPVEAAKREKFRDY